MRILTARWVFPAARPPIRDGAVGIHAGRIVAVGRRADVVAACAAGERWDLGEAALLPGLVSCHTHLEIGKRADVIAVAAERVAAADPVGALLESTRGSDVMLVLIDGAVRHTRCEVPTCA